MPDFLGFFVAGVGPSAVKLDRRACFERSLSAFVAASSLIAGVSRPAPGKKSSSSDPPFPTSSLASRDRRDENPQLIHWIAWIIGIVGKGGCSGWGRLVLLLWNPDRPFIGFFTVIWLSCLILLCRRRRRFRIGIGFIFGVGCFYSFWLSWKIILEQKFLIIGNISRSFSPSAQLLFLSLWLPFAVRIIAVGLVCEWHFQNRSFGHRLGVVAPLRFNG